jgi:hypothetical protein
VVRQVEQPVTVPRGGEAEVFLILEAERDLVDKRTARGFRSPFRTDKVGPPLRQHSKMTIVEVPDAA